MPVHLKILGLLQEKIESLRDLSNRMVFQKTIFILQEMGLDLGYQFKWYLNGPYSSALADSIEDLEIYADDIEGWTLTPQTMEVIWRYKQLFSKNMNNKDWLRLISSILFIRKHYKDNNKKEIDKLLSKYNQNRDNKEIQRWL